MSKSKLFLLIIFLIFNLVGNSYSQISKDQAIDTVLTKIVSQDSLNFNVYLLPNLFSGNEFNLSPFDPIDNPFDTSFLFFVDLMPEYGWSHPCIYVFVQKSSGNYSILNKNIPPLNYWVEWEDISVPFPHQIVIQAADTTIQVSYDFIPDPHKYALLITWNAWEDWARWNNLSHVYSGLKQTYGFMDENIFVLSGNGIFPDTANLNLDGTYPNNDFDGPCTRDSIADILSYLADTMSEEDIFFFYATTHGDTSAPGVTSLRLNNEEPLYDYDFANMIDSLICSQIIISIDACHAGGMADDLEGPHRTIQVPVPRGVYTIRNWNYYDYFTYAWATAMRGYHVYNVTTPWEPSEYKVGHHPNLGEIWEGWNNKIDHDPDSLNYGGNQDGFIQFEEVFNYAQYLDGQTQVSGINISDDGFRGDLLTLNGIEGRVDTTQSVTGPYLIGRKLTIAPNVTLTNNNYTNFYLNDFSEIYVSDSAIFNPYGYWTNIVGCSGESYITVLGDLRTSSMDFTANTNSVLNVCFINEENDHSFSHFQFENCKIKGVSSSLAFDESTFSNSTLEFTSGDLVLSDQNEFINSTIILSHPGSGDSYCNIIGNTFNNDITTNGNAVITIEDYSNFLIERNEIRYDSKSGIALYYAGQDAEEEHSIYNNLIRNTGNTSQYSELGIHSYLSNVLIENNHIDSNDYGIAGFHSSKLAVLGDSTAEDYLSTQMINANRLSQCIFSLSSFPDEFRWNAIGDTSDSMDKPYIKTVKYEEIIYDTTGIDWSGDPAFDVSANCWSQGLDEDPEERLLPVGAYYWDSIWCPHSRYDHEFNAAAIAYYVAVSDVENENYTDAEEGFKGVIANFPGSQYSKASLKSLFALNSLVHNSSYSSFKAYCDSLSANPGDSLIGVTARWFSIHCDIKEGLYQQAVNSLDSIITSPPSLEDSIYALIDLGYVYTKIADTTNQKSMLFSTHSDLIPNTYKKYVIQRDIWIEELLKSQQKEKNPPELFTEDELMNISAEISSVYPNPTTLSIDIDLEIIKEGTYHVMLYSLTGQEILQTTNSYSIPGTYNIRQDISMVPAGIYFLVLQNNGAILDSKKLVKSND